MSNKITKKQGKEFVKKFCKAIEELGAKLIDPATSSFISYELQTSVGRLEIDVPIEQTYCFTVFSRFDNVEEAKKKFPCNPHSGKYNYHGSIDPINVDQMVEISSSIFKHTI